MNSYFESRYTPAYDRNGKLLGHFIGLNNKTSYESSFDHPTELLKLAQSKLQQAELERLKLRIDTAKQFIEEQEKKNTPNPNISSEPTIDPSTGS